MSDISLPEGLRAPLLEHFAELRLDVAVGDVVATDDVVGWLEARELEAQPS